MLTQGRSNKLDLEIIRAAQDLFNFNVNYNLLDPSNDIILLLGELREINDSMGLYQSTYPCGLLLGLLARL